MTRLFAVFLANVGIMLGCAQANAFEPEGLTYTPITTNTPFTGNTNSAVMVRAAIVRSLYDSDATEVIIDNLGPNKTALTYFQEDGFSRFRINQTVNGKVITYNITTKAVSRKLNVNEFAIVDIYFMETMLMLFVRRSPDSVTPYPFARVAVSPIYLAIHNAGMNDLTQSVTAKPELKFFDVAIPQGSPYANFNRLVNGQYSTVLPFPLQEFTNKAASISVINSMLMRQ